MIKNYNLTVLGDLTPINEGMYKISQQYFRIPIDYYTSLIKYNVAYLLIYKHLINFKRTVQKSEISLTCCLYN